MLSNMHGTDCVSLKYEWEICGMEWLQGSRHLKRMGGTVYFQKSREKPKPKPNLCNLLHKSRENVIPKTVDQALQTTGYEPWLEKNKPHLPSSAGCWQGQLTLWSLLWWFEKEKIPYKLTGSGTVRRYGLAGVGVVFVGGSLSPSSLPAACQSRCRD